MAIFRYVRVPITIIILIATSLLQLMPYAVADTVPTCAAPDFHYEYTECDSKGGRWRVSVPTPNTCEGGAPNAPIRGTSCVFTCGVGEYLNLNNQSCTVCPPGTYSLGGGVRYDDWAEIPALFAVQSTRFSILDRSMDMFADDDKHRNKKKTSNCTGSEWTAAGDYVMVMPRDCSSTLMYATSLVRPGVVTFEYQHTNPANFFRFSVQNEKCQSVGDKNSNKWPKVTKNGRWSMIKITLKTGTNVLSWKVMNFGLENSVPKPVLVRNIQITGIAYTSACAPCKPGTFSEGGKGQCDVCDENTYSERKALTCTQCNDKDEYSPPGSIKCQKRPSCTKNDYFAYTKPCDVNNKTGLTYKWMQPHVCRTDLIGAAQRPAETSQDNCPACNSGMHHVEGVGCRFCAHEEYSDGTKACARCLPSTSPKYGHDYKWWYELPQNMSTDCLSNNNEGCATKMAWVPSGDKIQTGEGKYDDAYMLLSLELKGFHGKTSKHMIDGKTPEVGTVEFVFDTECEMNCYFLFALERGDEETMIVNTWSGKQTRQKYTYSVLSTQPATFTWAFQKINLVHNKGAAIKKLGSDKNLARIYSITVTNTLDGAVISCTPCPIGVQSDRCVPCPLGHYIDDQTTKCVSCPKNTVVHPEQSWGASSCVACGAGLVAHRGMACVSDCVYVAPSGRKYDFSHLAKTPHSVGGSRLFTAGGAKYFHNFNISLCPGDKRPLVTCVRNMSTELQMYVKTEIIEAAVCRATIIPQQGDSPSVLSAHPVSLGDELTEIMTNNASMLEQYKREGFDTAGIESDVHFIYKTDKSTSSCVSGRTTVISMRCDIKADGNGSVMLPPKCVDGTCDGCHFHLLWHTKYACPLCGEADYQVIVGECVGGEQTLHYYPPTTCLANSSDPTTKTRTCSLLPFPVKIGLVVGAGTGLIMCLVLFYCWKRNRRLEYKYMKLVQNASSKDDELPAADSCGLDEGEDEHDHGDSAVLFSQRKGIKLLRKIKDKISTKDRDSFEEYRLAESESLT